MRKDICFAGIDIGDSLSISAFITQVVDDHVLLLRSLLAVQEHPHTVRSDNLAIFCYYGRRRTTYQKAGHCVYNIASRTMNSSTYLFLLTPLDLPTSTSEARNFS